MSLADVATRSVSAAFNAVHADVWRILSGSMAGSVFMGEAQSEAPHVLETELGSDSRERTYLYVDRPAPPLVRLVRIEGKGVVWQVVGEVDDNPVNDRIKFEIQKIGPRDTTS